MERSSPWAMPAFSRRMLLRLAGAAAGPGSLPALAADAEAFALVEAAFASRLRGPQALARVLGMGRLRPSRASGAFYHQFLADAAHRGPFASLEMRLSRTRLAGIAVLEARPGLAITPETVRARYGLADWGDVRPELPTFYFA